MSPDLSPAGLEEISAYLDGELDAARRRAVEERLARDEDAARRLADYRRQDEMLRRAFADLGPDDEAAPLGRIRRRPLRGWAIAATIVACVLGAVSAWRVEDANLKQERMLAGLVQEAETAHLVYADGGRLPGAVDQDRIRVSARMAAVLGIPVEAPDLSGLGFRLAVLRELPTEAGPAALLVYRDAAGRSVTCYYKRLAEARETGFQQWQGAAAGVVYRTDQRVGYAVVGAMPLEILRRIAEVGYASLERAEPS